MRLKNPAAALNTIPRRLGVALFLLFVTGAVAALTLTKSSANYSATVANTGNTYAASSCFGPVPVSMISGAKFSPALLTVQAGCSVIWTNTTSTNHNSTSVPAGTWASQDPMGLNATYTRAFPTTGSFDYKCTRHSGMTGTITVN